MVCIHCQDSIGYQIYCLVCYSQQPLVPFHGEELQKTVMEMREELASKYNFDSVDQLTIQEVEEYYEVRQVVNARHINLSSNVPFPLYESNKMGNLDCWTELKAIDFSEGAAFIGDPELDPQHVPGIIGFFSSLVRFDTKKRTDHVKDSVVYDAIPEMFIEFARKSRVDHGFRLLSRMVHHAFDSRITPMEQCYAKLIVDMHGTVGFQIK